MGQLGFSIVGTGFIAGVIANSITRSSRAKLVAVSSRKLDKAKNFTAKYPGAAAVEGVESLLTRADVEAVYIATPTVAKEKIALACIAAGKHVLVDKPFMDHASVLRMTQAAAAKDVVFMDATHFVHHPRTAAIQAATAEKIGQPRSLHTTFYFPFSDRNNIRFDRSQEPMTVIGDMAWYSMRAVVEYLRPAGRITKAATAGERDPVSGAFVRASGLIAFESGEDSTFDVGYTADTILMTLQLVGTQGVIGMDDFVLDWTNGFSFQNPDIKCGYSHRTGMATRKDAHLVPTPAAVPQDVAMIDDFVELIAAGKTTQRAAYVEATLKTQEYLDTIFAAAN